MPTRQEWRDWAKGLEQELPANLEHAKQPMPSPNPSPKADVSGDNHQKRLAKIGLYVSPVLLGIGVGLMGYGLFWPGVSFVLIAIALWLNGSLHDEKLPSNIKTIVVIALTVGTLWFLRFIVFSPAPLCMELVSHLADYPNGAHVEGIEWKDGMSELRISIVNQSNHSYDDVNIKFRADGYIRKIVKLTDFPCTFVPVQSGIRIDVTATGILSDGRTHAAYVVSGPTNAGFRMVCTGKFPPGRMEILVVTGRARKPEFNSYESYMFGSSAEAAADFADFWGPRQAVTQLEIDGNYSGLFGKPHYIKGTFPVSENRLPCPDTR